MFHKTLKTPKLTTHSKILCFDLETNGLHGEVFAVGALVIDAAGKIYEEFTGRTKIVGQVDPWVEQNVVPVTKDMPITHASYKALREAFWKWYVGVEPTTDYVLVSNGYPVEHRFLLKCQEENLEERYWQHPFPLLDLSSMMIMIDENAATKNKIVADIIKSGDYNRHHPLDDAKISALAAFQAFRLAGKIVDK